MKKIFVVIALMVGLSMTLQSQTFSVTPSAPVYAMSFKADSIKATDTNWVSFYAPANMYVQAVHVVASVVDSGASGSGAGSFKLYKYGTSTAIVQDSVLTAHTVVSGSPSSAAAGKLTKGYVYKVSWTMTGSERLDDVTVIIWYRW